MICANPESQRIGIEVGTSKVILIVRRASDQEHEKFMKSRYKAGRGGKVKDESWGARIGFMDSILIGIEAEDENGHPEELTYLDRDSKESNPLTKDVPNWISYVSASWKISGAIQLEELNAHIEGDTLKN